jgi:molybdenum cofactor cytidylyltransferase
MERKPPPLAEALSAVVLAAGLSQRMGGPNKLLLDVSGAPLVRRVLTTLLAHPFAELIVVTGHEADAVEEALGGLDVRFVRNPRFAEGQMSSVRAGLAALEAKAAGVMVALGDQPWLTSDDVASITAGFLRTPGCRVLVPTFEGQRGNPIVLSRASLDDILQRGGNFGCRQFITKNQDLVTTLPMPNDHVTRDIDTPEDLARLAGEAL